jgi:hypothetical protein
MVFVFVEEVSVELASVEVSSEPVPVELPAELVAVVEFVEPVIENLSEDLGRIGRRRVRLVQLQY